MKAILMALAITAIAYSGAEAQHCGIVPKHICKISPDRKSINCYSAVYGVNVATPYKAPAKLTTTNASCYRSGGTVAPGSKTVIIKENAPKNLCKRDDNNKLTECTHTGYTFCQNANGDYSYCRLVPTESGSFTAR